MIICDYYRQFKDKKIVVGLGYFDSVHKGHTYLIDEVKRIAKAKNALPAIFTFVNNPFGVIGKDTKSIFTFEERVNRLEHLDVELIIGADASSEFFAMSGEEFLQNMTNNFDIVGFVSGTDYTYGSHAKSTADDLVKYANSHNIEVSIVDLLKASGKKISSRDIRDLLVEGKLNEVNSLLSEPYSICGKVRSGRRDGGKIGFPTANIDIDESKLLMKSGVYSSIAIVDDKKYRAVTNVGGHPTFDDNRENIEAYIIDFDEDIYDKEIEIVFYRWLRGVKKFDSIKELQDTIHNDEITTINEVIL